MKDYNSDKLKSDFINSFGEEKWNGIEMIDSLEPEITRICNYLGVEAIPVVMDTLDDDARYMFKENYIIVSEKYSSNKLEVLKCLLHELRHYYQFKLMASDDKGVLANAFRDDFKKLDAMSPMERAYNTLELDAYAFTKYIMKKWYDREAPHPDELFDTLIDHYIEVYLVD